MLWDLLVATATVTLGASFLSLAWRGWQKRVAMRQWPTAPASIRGYRTRMGVRSTFVDVEVRYRHQGLDYTVWCVSPTGSGYGRDEPQAVRQVATIVPVKSTQPVYVNPSRADEAYLFLPEFHLLALFAGFGVIVIGLAVHLFLLAFAAVDAELATLGFMTLVGLVLTMFAVVLGIALAKTPLPRPLPSPSRRRKASRTRSPRRRRR